jgi:hypothetical protein
MHNLIQFLNAGGSVSASRAKRRLCQPRTIDAPIRIEDSIAKVSHHFPINGFTRPHEFVGDRIGLNQVSPERHKHFTDYGFATSNPAGQSDFQHSSLIFANPVHHRVTETQRKPF